MKPTDVLMSEHRVIERVLDCLERIAAIADETHQLPRANAAAALEVLGTFADRCHHAKEERVLFPALERRGLPRDVGPVAVMLNEHEHGRRLVASMKGALADAAAPVAPMRFAQAAREYVEHLRDHIAKEDGVLLPMADSILDEADRARVLDGFRNAEVHDVGAGTHERMLALVDELTRELDVASATRAAHHGSCCHGACGNSAA